MRQCLPQAINALRIAGRTTRLVRPMSTGSESGPKTIRLMTASQAVSLACSGVMTGGILAGV